MRSENGFGSITKLSGARRKPYAVRITTGWEDGKQVRKYLGFYATQADALLALAEYHKTGYDLDANKLTFGEVFDRWYRRIESTASANLLSGHKIARDRFGSLANKRIKDIKADHLQDWMDSITDLKPSTKKRIKSTLNQMYDYAVKNDLVVKNIAKFVEVHEKSEKTGAIFTDEEIKFLWSKSEDETVQDILILIYSGMRIGELLKMEDKDVKIDEAYAIGGSKTEAGKDRVIPFHDKTLPFVKKRLETQKYIVEGKKDRKLTYRAFQYRFKSVMDSYGWEHNIHDTRKTGISLMHRAGVQMETIRIIVGHSGKGITEQVYLYKDPKELVEAVNKIDI